MNCLICDKEFQKRAHNQFLCGDPECKRINANMLTHTARNKKREEKLVPCKICSTQFKPFSGSKMCSEECRKKNTDAIKLKSYIKNVMPTFKYKPKLTEEEKETNYKKYRHEYNRRPERVQYMKEYRLVPENNKKEKVAAKSYKKRNPEKGKNGHLKRNYKIDLDQYNQMLLDQNLVCGICLKEEAAVDNKLGKVKDLAVDHCHITGKVRGLLCFRCNTSLGKFEDSIEILQRAIDYLNKSRELETSSLTNPQIHDTINDQELK